MILILSDKNDTHVDALIQHLNPNAFFRFNLDVESLKKTYVTFKGSFWAISCENQTFSTNKTSCVWSRRTFVELLIEEEYNQSIDFKIWKNEWNRTLLGIYLSLKDVNWMNPISKGYQAENKYLQMDVAKKAGLKMPAFLLSNNKREILEFAGKYERVVLKIMEQSFYKTDDGVIKGLYVNVISKMEIEKNFNTIEENPIFIQEYIDKAYEVRYTVVDKEHFVCKIESQKSDSTKIDWRRYNIPQTPHHPINPPDNIRANIDFLMSELNIIFGAIDFIVTPDNQWYFLEINSMGQYLWIEDLTGLSITKSIANWLKRNLNNIN